jgi:hypothetical protein
VGYSTKAPEVRSGTIGDEAHHFKVEIVATPELSKQRLRDLARSNKEQTLCAPAASHLPPQGNAPRQNNQDHAQYRSLSEA